MRGFWLSMLSVACIAAFGGTSPFPAMAAAQGEPAAATEKVQVYNKVAEPQNQGGGGLSGMLANLSNRQPYKMQTVEVKKSFEQVIEEAQEVNRVNAEKQFQINQMENKKRFNDLMAAYEVDVAHKRAERAALLAQQSSGQQPNGVDSKASSQGISTGVKPEANSQIRVYVPKKTDSPEKPRRLFNVREQ